MGKILSCITNKLFLSVDSDYNKLYILAVINNTDITWHMIDIKNTNKEQIIFIYDYFKKKYNKKKVNIYHYENIEIKYDNIKQLISQDLKALFLKVYFEEDL